MIALARDVAAALRETLSRPFRAVALKIVAITVALLLLVGLAAHHWLTGLATPTSPWLAGSLAILEGLGLAVGGIFLVAPASSMVAGFFVDELADRVERDIDPRGPMGRPLPVGVALLVSVRFGLLTLGVLAIVLALLLVPGVNAVALVGANAYLSGRQYFEFAALRYRSPAEVAALRRAHAGRVFAAGLCIALFLAVPVLNLLAPLFGTALMVRLHRRLAPLPSASVGPGRL